MNELLITNVRIVDENYDENKTMQVLVSEGKIAKIAENIDAKTEKTIDGQGFLLMPGLIDMSCKICEAGFENNSNIVTVSESAAAGGFTQNRVKAESVKLCKKNIANGRIQAIIANSGNANCCTGEQGAQNALRMAKAVEKATGVSADDVIVCSTGVIGAQLPVEKIEQNIDALAKGLCKEGHTAFRLPR